MVIVSIIVLILAVAGGVFFAYNPFVFGRRTGESHSDFVIYSHAQHLDDELFHLFKTLGKTDFRSYRQHCLRVLTFANYFLTEEVLQDMPRALELAAVAIAYHDVALWTDGALNYLEPSASYMMSKVDDGITWSVSELELIREVILQHHKITPYSSSDNNNKFNSTAAELVNAVRKADWTDFSFGIVRFGLPAPLLEAAYDQIPEAGFHLMLVNFVSRLSPNDWIGGNLEVLKIYKW
jgi:hypothetical protein